LDTIIKYFLIFGYWETSADFLDMAVFLFFVLQPQGRGSCVGDLVIDEDGIRWVFEK
jgi:hypothetical protein